MEDENSAVGSSSPRAFATGTGFVFQVAGFVLLLGSCCLWSFSGRLFHAAEEWTPTWSSYLAGPEAPKALATIGLVATFVGGLALVATGLGLQGERPRSGGAAMAAAGLPAIVQGVVGVMLVRETGSWAAGVIPALLAAVGVVLFLLAGHSREILKHFPPPPDQSVVSDDFLRELARKRRERGP